MNSHMSRILIVNGRKMKVNFAVHIDERALNQLATEAASSPSGTTADCDGAIWVAVLSMTAVDKGE